MKVPIFSAILLVILSGALSAQQRKTSLAPKPKAAAQRNPEIGQQAIVIDDTLSVLREKPSLFSPSFHRMHRGRKVQILGVAEADGVKFFRVSSPPSDNGWIQSEAVFGKFRPGDDERLARLVQASDGFDQIEVATEFFNLYPDSKFRPSILLLFGDVLEEVAATLSRDATKRLKRGEMAATGAPLHSYYLNFVMLDRYRKIGILFVFDSGTKLFHYDGESWKEILKKFPKSAEASEAQKRLDALKAKMDHTAAK
jgi:hypothetical protein